MKSDRYFDAGSVALLLMFALMFAVFITCGDDDDDDGEVGYSPSTCEDIVNKLNECRETSYTYRTNFGWEFFPGEPREACFLAWCEGAGYDSIGVFEEYDFPAVCFQGTCKEIGMNFIYDPYDAYDEAYEKCYSNINLFNNLWNLIGVGDCVEDVS